MSFVPMVGQRPQNWLFGAIMNEHHGIAAGVTHMKSNLLPAVSKSDLANQYE